MSVEEQVAFAMAKRSFILRKLLSANDDILPRFHALGHRIPLIDPNMSKRAWESRFAEFKHILIYLRRDGEVDRLLEGSDAAMVDQDPIEDFAHGDQPKTDVPIHEEDPIEPYTDVPAVEVSPTLPFSVKFD